MTRYRLQSGSEEHVVEVSHATRHEARLTVDGEDYRVLFRSVAGNLLEAEVNGTLVPVEWLQEGPSRIQLLVAGEEFTFTWPDLGPAALAPVEHSPVFEVGSLLPGKLVSLPVKEGDMVSLGDVVAVVESMKMETAMSTDAAGRVIGVLARKGDFVKKGQPLVRLARSKAHPGP